VSARTCETGRVLLMVMKYDVVTVHQEFATRMTSFPTPPPVFTTKSRKKTHVFASPYLVLYLSLHHCVSLCVCKNSRAAEQILIYFHLKSVNEIS
jgi:hypothetical protein